MVRRISSARASAISAGPASRKGRPVFAFSRRGFAAYRAQQQRMRLGEGTRPEHRNIEIPEAAAMGDALAGATFEYDLFNLVEACRGIAGRNLEGFVFVVVLHAAFAEPGDEAALA